MKTADLNMKKIIIKLRKNDEIWYKYAQKLSCYGNVKIILSDEKKDELKDADILITTSLTEDELEKLKNCEAIFLFKTGTDALPEDKIKKRNIRLFTSHANSGIIAEHAVALALCLLHRINEFDKDLREGIWFSDGTDYFWQSIDTLKIGILGYGSIGHALAEKLSSLNTNITVLNKSGKYDENVSSAENLKDLILKNDLIFICVPKNAETEGMIDKNILNVMKNKYIVNVSRAEICNEHDLYYALKNGKLKGYASDVWYKQPDKKNRTNKAEPSEFPFNTLKNVVMSPHCATHSFSSHEKYIADACRQCIEYLNGELK